jgi:membrane associated rhomboid family serine protease
MFPISDVIPSRTRPVVTTTLIALNTLVFLYQFTLSDDDLRQLVYAVGVVPAAFSLPDLVTSMFVHADLVHFLGNMVFLWIFGDNVEDRLGHGKYAAFYLAAGSVAAVAQVVADPLSRSPMIGASGAIAAVMGAYFVLYPQSRVLTAVFLVIFLDVIEIPAVFFLGVWFLLQLVHASMTPGQGIAFWAHATGFVMGLTVGGWVRYRDGSLRAYWLRADDAGRETGGKTP